MGKSDFFRKLVFHRKPRQALRLGYGYIRGRKVSGKVFLGGWAKNGEIKMCCLEKSWRCRDTRF